MLSAVYVSMKFADLLLTIKLWVEHLSVFKPYDLYACIHTVFKYTRNASFKSFAADNSYSKSDLCFLYNVTFYLYFTFARSFLFSAIQFVLQTGKVKFHNFI